MAKKCQICDNSKAIIFVSARPGKDGNLYGWLKVCCGCRDNIAKSLARPPAGTMHPLVPQNKRLSQKDRDIIDKINRELGAENGHLDGSGSDD